MPRAHWLILAVGIVLMVLATLQDSAPPGASTVMDEADDRLGAPDLFMEGAEISQFDPAGVLRHRIRADTIVHYPDAAHTLLSEPALTLYRPGDAPWEITAHDGRIIGGDALLDGSAFGDAESTTASTPEQVQLENSVVLRRQRGTRGFVELRTDRLTLHPEREYAETDAPVIIDTDTGRTTATGMTADLASGRIELDAEPGSRVRTTLFPGTLR